MRDTNRYLSKTIGEKTGHTNLVIDILPERLYRISIRWTNVKAQYIQSI